MTRLERMTAWSAPWGTGRLYMIPPPMCDDDLAMLEWVLDAPAGQVLQLCQERFWRQLVEADIHRRKQWNALDGAVLERMCAGQRGQ